MGILGVLAAVFGRAVFKSLRRKREYRECKRMLAKLKRVSGAGRGLGGLAGGEVGGKRGHQATQAERSRQRLRIWCSTAV